VPAWITDQRLLFRQMQSVTPRLVQDCRALSKG
jgi:hypothetical protein